MDPFITLMQEASEMSKRARDKELATPPLDPSSPFLSPPSTSGSLYIIDSNQQVMSSDDLIRKLALKSQDLDHRRRFERFLHFHGVTREPSYLFRKDLRIGHIVDQLSTHAGDELPDDLDVDTNDPDDEFHEELVFERQRVLNEGCDDPDYIYNTYHSSSVRDRNNSLDDFLGYDYDTGFTYTKIHSGCTLELPEITKPPHLPENLTDSHLFWDFKTPIKLYNAKSDHKDDSNGSVIYRKCNGRLQLQYLGESSLDFEQGKKFKNNLSCFSNEFQVFFTASNSEIYCYLVGENSILEKKNILRFDTRPSTTDPADIVGATWPYFPYTINYVNISVFQGREVLLVACDDSRVVIYYVDLLMDESVKYRKISSQRNNLLALYGIRIAPDFQLKLERSAWSVDCYDELNLVAVSDNSQTVTLFCFEPRERKFYFLRSHVVLHNIPDVSFIKAEEINKTKSSSSWNITRVQLACVSISRELIIFEFSFSKMYGPFKEVAPKNGTIFCNTEENTPEVESTPRIFFQDSARVISRTHLNSDGWTVNYVDGRFFKEVGSFNELQGIEDDVESGKESLDAN